MYQKRGRKMKVIVVGGVAAGTKAAAKLKREDRNADIRIGIGSRFIEHVKKTYAGCVIRLEVEEENERAVKVYEKNEFHVLPYMEMITNE